jgi:hypothetical protein
MSGSPASADEISAERIADHVVALLGSSDDPVIRKWHGPIRYRIDGLDDASRKVLSDVFLQLGPATGLSVDETFDRRENNVVIIFTDNVAFWAHDEWAKKIFKDAGEDDKQYSDRFARELMGGSKRWVLKAEQDGRIMAVIEIIYTPNMLPASKPKERGARLAGVAFRKLALVGPSDVLPSIKNRSLAFATPTRVDIAFIRALYDPEISLAMPRPKAAPIIARKMSEQLLQR